MSEELREKIAKVINPFVWDGEQRDEYRLGPSKDDALAKADSILALLEAEGDAMRERCAALVENWNGSTRDGDTLHIAMAIRDLPLSALPVLGVGR